MTRDRRLGSFVLAMGTVAAVTIVVIGTGGAGAPARRLPDLATSNTAPVLGREHRTYPVSWQSTVVASQVSDRYGPQALRYGTPVSTASLTKLGERVRSTACDYRHCWAIGVTSQGLEYPLTRPAGSRTWRIGGPWFAGQWADGVSYASRIQILSPTAVIAFTLNNWAYISTNGGESWSVVGLGHVVRATVAHNAVGAPTYAVTAETESAPIQARTYTSSNGVVWRLEEADRDATR